LLTADLQADVRQRIKQDNLSRAEAEKAVLGTDHGEVGAVLLHSWHLPTIWSSRRQPSSARFATASAPFGGDAPGQLRRASGRFRAGWDGYAVRINNEVVTSLEITPEQIEHLVINVRESFDRVDQFMNLA